MLAAVALESGLELELEGRRRTWRVEDYVWARGGRAGGLW